MKKIVGILVVLSNLAFTYCFGQSPAELAKFSSAQAALVFSFHGSTSMLTKDNLEISVFSRSDTIRIRGSELKKWPGESYNRSRLIATQISDSVQISFLLRSDRGDSAVSGTFSLKPKGDWVWGVDFNLAPQSPSRLCIGCMGSLSFPLQDCCCDSIVDSLYVIWSGNSITNPVIY